MTTSTLECTEVGKSYSGLRALSGVNLQLATGEVTALVGANGAGKTTLLDVLSGTVRASEGSIRLGDRDVTSLAAWRRARLGLLRGFQDSALFPDLTVEQTLRAATYRTQRYGALEAIFRIGRSRRNEARIDESLAGVASQYGLLPWLDTEVDALSLGMAKIVQLAAVSIARPQWILLDEPAAGLARAEVDQLALLLRKASSDMPECGFLIVEHDALLVSVAADRVVLMAEGNVLEDLRRGDQGWADLLHPSAVPPTARDTAAEHRAEPSKPRDTAAEHRAEPSKNPIPPAVVTARPVAAPVPSADRAECVHASNIYVSYGRFEAVHGIDITIRPGRLSVLVGTNGAGKSSVLNAIVGIKPPRSGEVTVDGKAIHGMSPHRRAQEGLVLVPSGRGLMSELTVAENLRLTKTPPRAGDDRSFIEPLDLFPELKSRLKQRSGTMSGGEQQMLALARSIQLRPKYLLIDELSLGLNPMIVDRLVGALLELRDAGLGLLIVEQNAPLALGYSDDAFVMNNGVMSFSGPSAEAAAMPGLFRPVFLDPSTD